jgi:DNA repair exonuclease SbcCD ATPase subunit
VKYARILRLKNWMSFKGEHELVLEPKSYAVVARHIRDAERSNWLGKSALFEAVDFVLRGVLNPDRHMNADGWITDGEKDGYVELVSDGGVSVKRSKKIGQSTQLVLEHTTESNGKAKGDEAQALIVQMMGVSHDDYTVTSYFRQRQMARFILARPEDRMDYARAWFKLGPLEAAEESSRKAVSALMAKHDELTRALEWARHQEKQIMGDGSMTLDAAHQEIKRLGIEIEASTGKLGRLQEVIAGNVILVTAAQKVSDYETLFSHHTALVDAQDDVDKLFRIANQAEAISDKLKESLQEARREADVKDKLAHGKFDGHCPVAEMQCPVSVEINKQTERNAELLSAAQLVFATKRATYEQAERDATSKEAEYQEALRRQQRIDDVHGRLVGMRDAYMEAKKRPPPADVADIQARVLAAHQAVSNQTTARDALTRLVRDVEKWQAEQKKIAVDLEKLNAKIATRREAVVIFGKNGAQRRVAESALAAIQRGANDVLTDCGINLSVDVSWGREGAGPAKTCDGCGTPFPTSRKVTTCARCGAERGPLIINKLDILLSEQSGAAEDLAGVAIQLSASAWLREKRGSQWATAFIDEPVAQLDAAHRRMLAMHLAALLSSRYGFQQAFVIAHHASVLDALPGRIEVVSDGKYSTVRVAA